MPCDDAGYLIKRISEKLCARANADLKQHGLTFSQLQVLKFLKEKGGSSSQKDIEQSLSVTHPTATGLVTRMEKSGLVISSPSFQDRRVKVVTLTEKAKAIDHALQQSRLIMESEINGEFSSQEREEFLLLLNRVYQTLDSFSLLSTEISSVSGSDTN